MNHIIIKSDVEATIIEINGSQHYLCEYAIASGISQQDLIDTAQQVITANAIEPDYLGYFDLDYPKNGYEDFEDEIYNHGNY